MILSKSSQLFVAKDWILRDYGIIFSVLTLNSQITKMITSFIHALFDTKFKKIFAVNLPSIGFLLMSVSGLINPECNKHPG